MSTDFGRQISEIVRRTNIKVETVIERVALELSRRIIMATPVDKGTLRGNWLPAYDQPNLTYSQAIKDPNGDATIRAVLGHAKGSKMIGHVWYLTNSMPYAYRIEYEGYSKVKAPAGMVRVSVTGYHEALRKALL